MFYIKSAIKVGFL